jgi:tetratricopeptide (TPR) repeat protein
LKLSQDYWLFEEQGRTGELEDAFRQFGERARYPMMIAALAVITMENGREEEASRLFDELAASDFAHPTNNVAWLNFHGFCARVCAHLDRRDCVPILKARLEPWADQLIVASFAGWVTGPVAFHLGLLATTAGEWDEAESYFAAAAVIQERIAAPTFLARTRVEWARMLITRAGRDDAVRAHDLLNKALTTARERGLAKLERDAVALLSEA